MPRHLNWLVLLVRDSATPTGRRPPSDEDRINARDGEHDVVSCWASVDTVLADDRDQISDSREYVTR